MYSGLYIIFVYKKNLIMGIHLHSKIVFIILLQIKLHRSGLQTRDSDGACRGPRRRRGPLAVPAPRRRPGPVRPRARAQAGIHRDWDPVSDWQ